MLDWLSDPLSRLQGLVYSLDKDPSSWKDWGCLVFTLPADIDPKEQDAALLDLARLLAANLAQAEGYLFEDDESRNLLALCRPLEEGDLAQVGLRTLRHFQANADAPNLTYEIHRLSSDPDRFIRMIAQKFNLPSWPRKSPFAALKEPIFSALFNPKQTEPRRVLLVEDDPITRWLVRSALKDECHFATAGTADKALEIYRAYRPDLVFLDIGLPDRNGQEVLEWITRHDPGARVVMFTHTDNFDTMTDMLARGACGFIGKPFDRDRLLHYLRPEGSTAP